MNYKYVSSKLLIARVLEDFNVDYYDWIPRSFEWIGSELLRLGYNLTVVQADEPYIISVKDYTAFIPCAVETISYISKDGIRLSLISSPDFIDNNKKANTVPTNYYTINNGKIRTGFESGIISIYYKIIITEHFLQYFSSF